MSSYKGGVVSKGDKIPMLMKSDRVPYDWHLKEQSKKNAVLMKLLLNSANDFTQN